MIGGHRGSPELKVAGPSMLGTGCPDRHALPRITSPKTHRPRRAPLPRERVRSTARLAPWRVSCEGRLTEPTAAIQPGLRGAVFSPQGRERGDQDVVVTLGRSNMPPLNARRLRRSCVDAGPRKHVELPFGHRSFAKK